MNARYRARCSAESGSGVPSQALWADAVTALAAGAFNADGPFLSAGKKLLDTRHNAFRAVTAVRGKAQLYWRAMTLPFPEPGVRLIRQQAVDDFGLTFQVRETRSVELPAYDGGLDMQYADAGWSRTDHYAWIAGLLL